jgi:hypothetical protein
MMRIWTKGALAALIGAAALGGLSMPASAQSRGYRDGWRGDRYREWRHDRDDRRWRDRRDWRGDQGWRGRGYYRPRCWNEWRHDRYRGGRVRVRICR